MQTLTAPEIITTSHALTFSDRLGHFLARWGYKRGSHRAQPGLYRIGNPDPKSPVLVTANYTLSFDALRSVLSGIDAYILVLDTKGVNVWCAAGKGSFGTDELVSKIEETGLKQVVKHRMLILPQLGAPGIAAHEVKRRSHFKVEYGPVRAADLPAYLETRRATPEMRKVTFPFKDRLVLAPMELVHYFLPMLAAGMLLWLLLSPLAGWGVVAAFTAGILLFPLLLPWLPTRQFSIKGFVLGGLTAAPLAAAAYSQNVGSAAWVQVAAVMLFVSSIPAFTAYLGLNFTGSTPLTSRTGVEKEMKRYMPVIIGMGILSLVLAAALIINRFMGS